jgi:hypothetical protein
VENVQDQLARQMHALGQSVGLHSPSTAPGESNEALLSQARVKYKGDRDHVVPLAEQSLGIFKELPAWPGNDYFLFSTRDGRVPTSGFSKGKSRLDEEVRRA